VDLVVDRKDAHIIRNLHPSPPRHDTMPDARDLCNKAVELAESGQYDEALDLVNKGIKLDANNANAWYNKGIILFKMCKYQDALNSFAQATDIDPEFTEAWYNKGMALMNLQKYLEAIRAFDKALKINPHDRRSRDQRDFAQKKIVDSISFSPQSTEKQTKLIK
jgi:tetratricopeptide (TPR) repeat protein